MAEQIKRSEVHFMEYNTNHRCAAMLARSKKKQAYVLLDSPHELVFDSYKVGVRVGRVCDLIDDRK